MNLQDLYENLSSPQRAAKQLPADFQPANTSPQLSGPYPGRNATRGYLVGEDQELAEIYNPLDAERREQRAMDREREQFRRDELELELGGEQERMRAANEGTFYLRINGRIWRRAGEPVSFQGRERAVRAGQTIKDRDASREVVVTRNATDSSTVAKSAEQLDEIIAFTPPGSGTSTGRRPGKKLNMLALMNKIKDQDDKKSSQNKQPKPADTGKVPAYEDILTGLQKKLGDYLQDVATAVKRDPDLLDKMPKDRQNMQAVKTICTDDGHEIKIHGNEDDGFRISIKNRDIKSTFRNLDEAEMACDLYCAQRRRANYLDEKSISESYSEEEYAQAMQDFLARGGKIEKGVYKEPKLATRLRRQGSRHIGQGSEGRAGQLAGRGANIGGTGKPVVSVEETKKDACYNKVKSRYKVWPSAYASGALVQCRKKGAKNWGTKS